MDVYKDWRNIPSDIGYVILGKLPEIVDHVWFGAVCKNWYSVAKDYNLLTRPSHGILPMLLVPVSECETQRRFYSLSTGKIYPNVRLLNIPDKRCCGSSYGWLGFVEEDLSVTLVNPFRFRKVPICLPSLKTNPRIPYTRTVIKLIVLPDSTPEDYTVFVIYGGMTHLAFIRTGDKDWTYLVDYLKMGTEIVFDDIIFHKGAVYATDNHFKVVSINIHTHPPQIKVLKDREPFNINDKWLATYIVESTSGELYAVRRKGDVDNVTIVFKVLKLEFDPYSDGPLRCVELKSLNGDTIFIGDSYTVSVNGSNFGGCVVPNSIYYTDDFLIGDGRRASNEAEDSGIFNVGDRSFAKHYIRDPNHRFRPPAIWILPPYN